MARFTKRVLEVLKRVGAHRNAPLRLFTALLLCPIAHAQTTLSTLPFAPLQSIPQWRASTDTTRNNQDFLLLKPRETRRIALPSGALLRLWFTSSDPQKTRVVLRNGKRTIPLLQNGKAAIGELFAKSWTLYPHTSTRSAQQLAPSSFLIVSNGTREEMKFYFQATTQTGKSQSATASQGATVQVTSEWTLQPNASRDFAINGGNGIVEAIDIVFDAADLRGISSLSDREVLDGVRLQARWDDGQQLAVDATLAQLAGGWKGAVVPQSAVAKIGKHKLSLRWPMPLPPRRKLSLRNETKTPINFFITTTIRKTAVPASRFYARVGAETTVPQKPIGLLKVQGSGALVGLNLDMRPQPNSVRQTFTFLEGNEIIRADNRVLEGTGTEDFFNSAWYYPDKPFARAFHGLTRKTLAPPSITTYRWMIPDAVSFRKALDFTMGHSGRNKSSDMEYRWVAFWYANLGSTFEIANRITAPPTPTPKPAPNFYEQLANVIRILPIVFLVVGTLLWLKLSWRRKI